MPITVAGKRVDPGAQMVMIFAVNAFPCTTKIVIMCLVSVLNRRRLSSASHLAIRI